MITKADKGKTIVFIYVNDYNSKVYDFLNNKNFQTLRKDPTDKFQKLVKTALKQFDQIISKQQIKYLIQRKPQPPTLKAQIKIHKPNNPIRPVVNNINAPTYKLTKLLTKTLNEYLHLKYQYNVKDSITLAHDLKKLTTVEHHKMITFDIKDLYVNIQIKDTIKITEDMLSEQNIEPIKQQIVILLKTPLEQN